MLINISQQQLDLDYHRPLVTSPALAALHARVRVLSPHLDTDRYWADEMAAIQAAVLAGTLVEETVLD